MQQQLDQGKVREFAGRLFGFYNGALLTYMVNIGRRTGLFDAAAQGPATSEELARRAGLHERYVREWLATLTAGGVFDYDPATRVYTLPPEHAVSLAGDPTTNLTDVSFTATMMAKHVPAVAAAFAGGGGVPYSAFRPEFTEQQDTVGRRRHDAFLMKNLESVPGVIERLHDGARVADIGCGTGHAAVLMAQAFPRSSITGFEIAAEALAHGEAEARELGLTNVRFVVQDVAALPAEPAFDLVTSFDAIHDQAQPAAVLTRVATVLAPGGVYLMVEPRASSNLEDNLKNPAAPLAYGVSVLHCMTVSLAEGGTGLGTMWGEQRARQLLAAAGFGAVEVYTAPDRLNSIFACRM